MIDQTLIIVILCNWDHMHMDQQSGINVHEAGKQHLFTSSAGFLFCNNCEKSFKKEGEAFCKIHDGSFLIWHEGREKESLSLAFGPLSW